MNNETKQLILEKIIDIEKELNHKRTAVIISISMTSIFYDSSLFKSEPIQRKLTDSLYRIGYLKNIEIYVNPKLDWHSTELKIGKMGKRKKFYSDYTFKLIK